LWTLERDGGFRVPHDGGFLCLTRYDPTEGAYSSAVHWDWDSEHWNAVEIGTQDHQGSGSAAVSSGGSTSPT
jgi:hypothetical protein